MKKIIIEFDYTSGKGLSYVEVLKQIEEQNPIIHTNCLDFFTFSSLDKDYDVEVRKANGRHIVLSELLEDVDNVYTRKNIRKAHNVRRLLTANHFNFKES